MDTRIALIGVLLETRESVDKLNRPEQYHQRPFRQTRNASGRQHENDLRQNNVTYL